MQTAASLLCHLNSASYRSTKAQGRRAGRLSGEQAPVIPRNRLVLIQGGIQHRIQQLPRKVLRGSRQPAPELKLVRHSPPSFPFPQIICANTSDRNWEISPKLLFFAQLPFLVSVGLVHLLGFSCCRGSAVPRLLLRAPPYRAALCRSIPPRAVSTCSDGRG